TASILDVLLDAVPGPAIVTGDDDVLGDIDQPASQMAGLGGLQRCVRQSFPCSVGGAEVLVDAQPLAETAGDGRFENLAGRSGDQSTYPGELTQLLLAAARPGAGHQQDRVERSSLVPGHARHHFIGDVIARGRPEVDDSLAAIICADVTIEV